jgi:hypothetical protein
MSVSRYGPAIWARSNALSLLTPARNRAGTQLRAIESRVCAHVITIEQFLKKTGAQNRLCSSGALAG